ncbi:hypothetical protein FEAC_17190 [Ferrimicrobium acidiphilum DSM 19497]|uniref:Uncharacterized protein n=1 Tax=Ferrimicrobium acidiphilum DSM 19497 TaxID=1121877 RepID=A0A0D8FW61_9ACTN|nr:hypothetical protein FEAC_17190 [Ferrimicrobium acidiphilum DSM 19497]
MEATSGGSVDLIPSTIELGVCDVLFVETTISVVNGPMW